MEWQPIETAPKTDDSPSILLIDYAKVCVVGFWDEEEGEWLTDYRGKGNVDYVRRPTHWMPLPKPPTA